MLVEWLQAGMQADMHWMERSLEKRLDPQLVLPGARSIILLGVNYRAGDPDRCHLMGDNEQAATRGDVQGCHPLGDKPAGRARWARYALYEDYHDTMKPALVAAGRALEEMYGVSGTDYRYYVDTGPVIERGWAARAGLGFIGKNAMLISREFGNWLFLAAILTRVEFEPDEPIRKRVETLRDEGTPPAAATGGPAVGLLCGKCTCCLNACPTDAFARPGIVDARRCVSYQTIENKGVIPRELRAGVGMRIYGCDVCLEVCPWNRFAQEGRRMLLSSRADIAELPLAEILALTPERFAEVFRRTPIKRLKLGGLLRNACVVAGNSGDRSLLPLLVQLASAHPLPLVRAHAVWAVYQLGGAAELEDARTREQDAVVLAEYKPASAPGDAG
jgi:epoxyqueuosine reductase